MYKPLLSIIFFAVLLKSPASTTCGNLNNFVMVLINLDKISRALANAYLYDAEEKLQHGIFHWKS
ncbi:MAG: hypothetical protein F6K08_02310 [Okeania sp. SIO1H6]|nr:hypothetical protein [Okeania sp. SIO1H6]